MNEPQSSPNSSYFDSADWYDRGINWEARLTREIPVLREVLGRPGGLGLLDAGCGTGRQAVAMAQAGYRVTGVDASEEMLRVAADRGRDAGVDVAWVCTRYETLAESLNRSFDGVYCIGNSLAAAQTAEAVEQAIRNFAGVLRGGGRLFVQVLNFDAMRAQPVNVRGPRVHTVDGVEYVSYRHFHFEAARVVITNVTMWKDETWRHWTHSGCLYPVGREELQRWACDAGLRIDDFFSDYQRTPYDPQRDADLIVLATKT